MNLLRVYLLIMTGIFLPAMRADVADHNSNTQWTKLHRKKFTLEELENNKEKKELSFCKIDLPKFTQLIFSWNAKRPETGYFTFYVKVRDAQKKVWGKWHKMMEWGNNKQVSYKSKDSFSVYHHVRLEVNGMSGADGFCIKIVKHGADLSLIHAFAINVSDFSRFSTEAYRRRFSDLKTVQIKGAPKIAQFKLNYERNDGLCSPTSTTMLTSYLTNKPLNPIDFAENSFDTGLDKYGSWPFNTAHAFEHTDDNELHFAVTRCNSFRTVYDQLGKGIPVVVSVRGQLKGATRVFNNGHLLMVVGYDAKKKQVICHDPAVDEHYQVKKRYDLISFLKAWERSHRLTYLATR